MATATMPSVKAVPGANFTSKRVRKQARKSYVRAVLANRVAEIRTDAAERAAFYRELRHMKIRRIAIAKKMVALSISVAALQQQLRRVEDRNDLAGKTVAEKKALADLDAALDLGRAAMGAIQAAADEWQLFAKKRIYFTEVMA
ncbi:hypothetical protein [Actinoplanes xinjiangensis]|uniref:hypothetical protein n=1 Tax=Actinoplanes xinjiangensis TaxID=512350 RepID=UPI00344497D8